MATELENKTKFATIVFTNQDLVMVDPVALVQWEQGPGIGTTINCSRCLMDVDDILDNPEKHQKSCQRKLIFENKRQSQLYTAQMLKKKGFKNVEIARQMGLTPSSVRRLISGHVQ